MKMELQKPTGFRYERGMVIFNKVPYADKYLIAVFKSGLPRRGGGLGDLVLPLEQIPIAVARNPAECPVVKIRLSSFSSWKKNADLAPGPYLIQIMAETSDLAFLGPHGQKVGRDHSHARFKVQLTAATVATIRLHMARTAKAVKKKDAETSFDAQPATPHKVLMAEPVIIPAPTAPVGYWSRVKRFSKQLLINLFV
ncbi:MAG: hypothetical protein KGI69_01960 [Patescibacteria group bacterium]|nr:hypothetical protein [Patescibacteria group bacterium]